MLSRLCARARAAQRSIARGVSAAGSTRTAPVSPWAAAPAVCLSVPAQQAPSDAVQGELRAARLKRAAFAAATAPRGPLLGAGPTVGEFEGGADPHAAEPEYLHRSHTETYVPGVEHAKAVTPPQHALDFELAPEGAPEDRRGAESAPPAADVGYDAANAAPLTVNEDEGFGTDAAERSLFNPAPRSDASSLPLLRPPATVLPRDVRSLFPGTMQEDLTCPAFREAVLGADAPAPYNPRGLQNPNRGVYMTSAEQDAILAAQVRAACAVEGEQRARAASSSQRQGRRPGGSYAQAPAMGGEASAAAADSADASVGEVSPLNLSTFAAASESRAGQLPGPAEDEVNTGAAGGSGVAPATTSQAGVQHALRSRWLAHDDGPLSAAAGTWVWSTGATGTADPPEAGVRV